FVLAENPMLSDPDIAHVEEALKKLELLVVVDIFMTETAELAHVVLPGTTFAERDGTFTNSERRVQRIRKAVEPVGDAKEDWLILKELMERSGMPQQPSSPKEIFEELRKLTPQYAGMTYERIDEFGLQWPCPTEDHPGTPYLHKDKFARGKGQFFAIHHREPVEVPDEEYPFWLTTGRTYFHFHTTSMTRRSKLLEWEAPDAYVEVSREDAERLGIGDGDAIRLSTRRGSVEARAVISDRVKAGLVFIPFHFAEAAANRLTIDAVDPVANIPEFKVCAVRLEKVA
ncbi:MAG TPA: formate dehydrogenase subunit alpha, partial [Proteobacteria bacterium]|nr:formate dehydrogenase subunit alpha [Pseudomonadota bacterium]